MKKIAVASGKGGTGKTTISVNLSFILSRMGQKVQFLDCDVEEPNGHIYFDMPIHFSKQVFHLIPEIDQDLCNYCGECERICQFRAIMILGKTIIVNQELCHACGGCALICPEKAIKEKGLPIGKIEEGHFENIHYIRGLLNVGSVMSTPVIAELKKKPIPSQETIQIIDSPPGTSCPVIESVKGVEYIVLVAEPSPFGLHDLSLAVDMIEELKIPMGVIINRSNGSYQPIYHYIKRKNIPLLMEIPFDMEIARISSMGQIISKKYDKIQKDFVQLIKQLQIGK